jgi:hypothetical protein
MKRSVFILAACLFLTSCGSSDSQSFGGHCKVIVTRIASASAEVKSANGARKSLEQLATDFESFESDIADPAELALIKSIGLNSAWLVDYWDFPDKTKSFTIEKVSVDFLEDANNPLFNSCKN